MFEKQSRIIAVDNNHEHLSLLTSKFHNNGLGCLPLLYDQLTPPEKPYSNIRLAFFDINLRDITNESEVFNDLANALNDYIAPQNGPFALVFWTQNKEKVERLISYIAERRPETPRPYLISCIDKDQFLPSETGSLETTLRDLLSSPTLDLLLEYEENSISAASQTINEIYKLIPGDSLWGKSTLFDENFKIIFSKIAIASLGFHHAKENPDKAVYEALIPTTSSLLEASVSSSKWKTHLDVLANAKNNDQPIYPDGFYPSKLNSIFHIDFTKPISKINRGVVLSMDNNDASFKKHFDIQYSEWFSRLLPGSTTAIRNDSLLVAVEISAVCDFSQKKPRTYKYMLGVILKTEYFGNIDKGKIPQNLLVLDNCYFINEHVSHICLNLSFVFSSLESDPKLGSALFVLKKEIMDMIGNRYANHVSRIGITCL